MKEKTLPAWAHWFFPSIRDILFLAFLLAPTLIPDFTVLGDSDAGWHIRNGEHILSTGSIPRQDYFSHTCAGKPWYAWEWLADLFMAVIHQAAGLDGIALWASLTFSIVFSLLFLWLVRSGNNLFVATLFSLLAAFASTIHWHARPHLFTMVFLLGWIMMLDSVQKKGEQGISPPIWSWMFFMATIVFWTNLHGGFVTGLIMLGIYALGNFLSGMTSSEPFKKTLDLKLGWFYLRLLLICLLLTAINPYGFKVHQHILNTYFHSSYFVDNIAEFISPNFHWPSVKCFEALLVGSIIVLGISWKRLTFIETGVLLFWSHLALFSARHIPLYSLCVVPILVRHLSSYVENPAIREGVPCWFSKALSGFDVLSRNFRAFEMQFKGWFYPALSVLFLGAAALNQGSVFGIKLPNASFDSRIFPVKAAEFVESNPRTGNFFTTDQWGGYWIYRFYPSYPVFFDGRSDMYGEEFLKQYQKVVGLSFEWKSVLEKFQVGWILLPVKDSLATALKETTQWKVIYDDHVSIIFIRHPSSPALLSLSTPKSVKHTKRDKIEDHRHMTIITCLSRDS